MRNLNPESWKEDFILVQQALSGNQEAWNTLYKKSYRKVMSVAYQTNSDGLLSESDIREITNEAFTRCYKKLSSFRGDSLFSTWVCKFSYYICLETKRRNIYYQRKTIAYKNFTASQYHNYDPLSQLLRKELYTCIWLAFCSLSPLHRTFISYVILDGNSISKARTTFGISYRIIKGELEEAKKILRKRFFKVYYTKIHTK